jgi:hypothetical protein
MKKSSFVGLFLLPLSPIFPGLIFIRSSVTAVEARCFLSSFADFSPPVSFLA